jgi:type IV pilus assembly protein PilY1
LWAAPARAQKDVQPRLPNVLLLVDNSGSMEYLMDPPGKMPGAVAGTACDGSTNLAARNRWANLVTALTGSISDTDFSCRNVARSGVNFKNEYGLNGSDPYDLNYTLPFHRIYSNNCAYGAGKVNATWNWWNLPSTTGSGAKDWTYRDTAGAVAASCSFTQSTDGMLDAFRNMVRFGMMSIDAFPSPGTGSTAAANPATATADYPSGEKGMWSYYHNWIAGAPAAPSVVSSVTPSGVSVNTVRPTAGNPAGCATPSFMEVGARNEAAPPWEGRLVAFGDPGSDTNVPTINDQIQQQLLTMRPYGATPLAGLIDDAEEFLFNDTTTVPGKTYRFGPSDDQYWINGCRKTFVILLSDGQPNLDLRSPGSRACVGNVCQGSNPPIACTAANAATNCAVTGCDSGGSPTGVCPYDAPENIAKRLRVSPPLNQSVTTFVVGFTISDFNRMTPQPGGQPAAPSGATKCEDLDVSSTGTDCVNPPPELRGCCNLQKIALAGGSTHAYFADTQNKLKQTIAAILSQVIAGVTDRTWPVYAPAGNRLAQGMNFAGAPTASYQFASSFVVTAPPSTSSGVGSIIPALWNGRLLRERTSCPSSNIPTAQAVNNANGDDYAFNVDSNDSSHPRRFFTAIGEDDHNKIDSDYSIRPYNTVDDGLGTYKTQTGAPTTPALSATFASQMASYPEAFGMPSSGPCHAAFGPTVNDAQCTTDIVNWEVGLNNSVPAGTPFLTRDWHNCPIKCNSPVGCPCSMLGGIMHSTPSVVGPPREFLRDDSYTNYQNNTAVAKQPSMLYTATMDGQLHAFKVQANDTADSNTTDQATNNELWSFFPPAVLKKLLPNYNTAGVALLDGAPVIADVPGTLYTTIQAPLLARTGTSTVQWHRILLASGGTAGGFYYALDITDPNAPRFLWQLSTDDRGNPIFGANTPTPAIALVNVKIGGVVQQVPLAILPGGNTGAIATNCHGNDSPNSPVGATYSNVLLNDASNPHLLGGVTPSPPDLQCWSKAKNNNRSTGNSLVIARLDTGKVLGFFLGTNYSGGPKYGDGGDNGHGEDDGHDKHNHFTNVYDAPFQAPLSGVPVVYPGQTGQVSDRVYVGDADGLLWRLDMSDPDINNWAVKLAWDPYVDDTTSPTGGTSLREGISVPPIISRDPIGNPTILVATGDQDSFNVQPTTNHVWSLTENPLTHKVSPNWHIALPKSGARVTGPLALFNGGLYFATFLPQAGNVCSDGYASVWAVDFLRRGTGATAPAGLSPINGVWPLPLFPTTTPGSYVYGLDGAPRTIIMGVSVGETPTCDSTTTINDPYFGSHTALTGVSGSNYQVMWQTGAGGGLSTTNTAVKNDSNVSGVQFIQPSSPGRGTRIDSWASIVE